MVKKVFKKQMKEFAVQMMEEYAKTTDNDIDDALTMLMLMHSFRGIVRSCVVGRVVVDIEKQYVMNDDERVIYNTIESAMSSWFAQLAKE